MSTRRKAGQRSGQPPAKRRKREIGQANSDDDIPTAQAQANAPSAAALSQRVLPLDHIPSLGAICLKVFADNFQRFSTKEVMWENVRLWLKELPDALVQKIFTTLRHTCPTILNHGLIVSVWTTYAYSRNQAHTTSTVCSTSCEALLSSSPTTSPASPGQQYTQSGICPPMISCGSWSLPASPRSRTRRLRRPCPSYRLSRS